MAKYEYPVGLPIKTTSYQNGKMGIYRIEYKTNKNLAHAVLPRRDLSNNSSNDCSGGMLKWDLIDSSGVYSSVDIENALKFGYEIEVIDGYYWEHKDFIFRDYINELFQDKKNAKKGTPQYELAKLFMNSLYGKLLQRPIFEEMRVINKNCDFWKFFSTHRITEINYIGDKMYVKGCSLDEEKLEKNITKPRQLGSFVLAYSRRIMLEYMEKSNPYFNSSNVEKRIENDIYYTDTDSLQVHIKNGLELTKTGELGEIDDDLKGGKIIRGIWISPKLYALEYVMPDNSVHYHLRAKGISNDKMSFDKYIQMLKGEELEIVKDFQMKKIHLKRNSKQQDIANFSILHQTDLSKKLNRVPWDGRVFFNSQASVCRC